MTGNILLQDPNNNIDQLNQRAWDIRVSDSVTAQQLSKEALKLSEETGYIKGKAEGLRTFGFCLVRLSKHQEAYECLTKSLSLFESLADLRGQSTVYEYFGIIQRSWGNLGKSLELLLKSLELSEQTDFEEAETTNLYQIGVTYRQLGNYEKALDYLYKGLSKAQLINFSLMVGYSINVIGSIYFETGDYNHALDFFQQGLILRQKAGDKWGEAGSLDNIGYTFLKLNDLHQAIVFCKQSLAINQSTGDKKGQANALLHLAEIFKQSDDLQQAYTFCQQSLEIRQSIADKKGEAEILLFLAQLQRDNFKKDEKEKLFTCLFNALTLATEIKAIDLLSKTHWALYESYKMNDQSPEALFHLELHIKLEKELHKETINQKILNLEIAHKAEESKKEAEIFRLRNVELADLYAKTNKQKVEIEAQKKNVEATLSELKATQYQLIQSAKMASLGELTAGIAHEIQNPLNFVNNFSEVNKDLIEEMQQEINKGNYAEVKEISNDIQNNEKKINHHGKRAEAIVKGMLQHSRSSTGQKELIDINALTEEYLRLSYHGFRAKDKSFNATLRTDFDESIKNIHIIPQDIGRVLLNLFNNAFYAVSEKKKHQIEHLTHLDDRYEPTVSISTKNTGDKVLLSVADNGNGIAEKIVDKIFQPFFTTKPTGQGTGLGLSVSYDIIKAQGGQISVESKEGECAAFMILLPLK